MLQVDALKKSYGSLVAVNGISLRAGVGEIVGLLGPNGAGKTTTVSMIAGLVRPDSGSVRIEGRPLAGDTDPNKRRIGLVPQDLALFDELTAQANLQLFAALYDLDGPAARRAIGEALELVGLADRAQERVKNYSGGMKRRLNLAAALLHDPQILLLDEPTVGSIRRAGMPFSIILKFSNSAARRWFIPPTTWKRPSGSAIGSLSSTTATS